MRSVVVICCLLFLSLPVLAQGKADPQSQDSYSIQDVKAALKEAEMGVSLSFTEKHISWLGDRVSIALLKIYDADGLKDPQNIRKYLPVVRTAFIAPRIIQIAEDQKPKVTMFFLTSLEMEVTDMEVKDQISSAIRYIKEQTSKE